MSWSELAFLKSCVSGGKRSEILMAAFQDYKKTQKITWLTDVEGAIDSSQGALIPAVCVQYDHIITKGVLDKDEDFKSYINTDSKVECCGHAEIRVVVIFIPVIELGDPHRARRDFVCVSVFLTIHQCIYTQLSMSHTSPCPCHLFRLN